MTAFTKMQGCGNDFLFFDAMKTKTAPTFTVGQIQFLCDRHFGAGADGLVVLRPGNGTHAVWEFFNDDGSSAEMCGNAARCAIRYLKQHHFPGDDVIGLQTIAGVVKGRELEDGRIEVTLLPGADRDFTYSQKVFKVKEIPLELFSLDTGVPHSVIEVQDLLTYPVGEIGAEFVRHPAFGVAGTNVTFFQRLGCKRIRATTFERGVERETLACGTGAAAAAIIYSERYLEKFPITVAVPGGDLEVDLGSESKRLLLRGDAREVLRVEVDEFPTTFEQRKTFGRRTV